MRALKPIAASLAFSMTVLSVVPAMAAPGGRRFGAPGRTPAATGPFASGSPEGTNDSPNPTGTSGGSTSGGSTSGGTTSGGSTNGGTPGGGAIGSPASGNAPGMPGGPGGFGNNTPSPRPIAPPTSGPFSPPSTGNNGSRNASGDEGGFNLGRLWSDFSGLVNTLYEIVFIFATIKDMWGSLGDLFGKDKKGSAAASGFAAAPSIGNNVGRDVDTRKADDGRVDEGEDAEGAEDTDNADAAGLKRE